MDNAGDASVTDGIYYAANNGAGIINLSLGGPGISVTEQTAVVFAYNQGVTLLDSSGNYNTTVPEYPAACQECISVGAVQYDQTRAPYSNYRAEPDLIGYTIKQGRISFAAIPALCLYILRLILDYKNMPINLDHFFKFSLI